MKTRKGYVSEGRVLLGLSICRKGNYSDCHKCPYNIRGCCSSLSGDALRYIDELERMVMEYEEKENKS